MEPREYEAMARLEGTLWWYRALHDKVLFSLGASFGSSDRFTLLDAGCGTGGLIKKLQYAFPNASLHGIDVSEYAAHAARIATHAEITQGSVEKLPYESASFDAITSMDVMYHQQVDPPRMLKECARVLRPGGIFILNLPAHEWLRSYHDERISTARRYTLASVTDALTVFPLRRVYATYWNAVLFLPLLIRRKLMPAKAKSAGSDVADIPNWLNALFYAAARCENLLIRKQISIPFGSSVFAIYERR